MDVHSGSLHGCHSCKLKKDVQHESCQLSFIWGKMRTTGQEMVPQIALINWSKKVVGEGQYM